MQLKAFTVALLMGLVLKISCYNKSMHVEMIAFFKHLEITSPHLFSFLHHKFTIDGWDGPFKI
jgi:hypothetical protein